ncbi:MAG TPA: hypothetical protein VKD90_12500 [Gemmataceae bacterium]|nr:hypothetical protein [Gemmataceae bacterium]
MSMRLRLEPLDRRDLPAITVEQPHEAFAWALINELRRDPAGFADQLDGLRRGTVETAFGFAKSDPVVADLRRLLRYSNYPGHYGQALQILRSANPAGPLGWDDVLDDRAEIHTDWMRTHSFEHTGQDSAAKSYVPGYNTGYRGGDPDQWGYEPGRYGWWAENIGYTVGLMANSKAEYAVGRLGRVGFAERAAFIDVVSYVLEVNSPDMGHLQHLIAPDGGPGGGQQYNAIGIDLDLYDGPYERRDGLGEATLSTERLGLYRPGGTGGFITGLVYRDTNANGWFDAGEGLGATVAVNGPISFTETIDRLGSYGVYAHYVPNGTYTLTATAADGTDLGTRTLTIQNANAWFEYRATGPAPAVPRATVTGPTGVAGVRPTVTWESIPDALGYEIRLTDLTTGRLSVFPGATTNGPPWTPPRDLVPGHAYRVVVRALFAQQDGEWSPGWDFVVGRAEVTGPGPGTTTLRPCVSWTPVAGASAYVLRVNDLTTGRTNLFGSPRTTGTTWTVPVDLVSGHSYSVRVRALNSLNQGTWGPAATFSIGTPRLIGPAGEVFGLRPSFSWTAIDGTAVYGIAIDDLTTGRTNLYRQSTTGTSWGLPADLVAGHSYQWRVAARNAAGAGQWGPCVTFHVNP